MRTPTSYLIVLYHILRTHNSIPNLRSGSTSTKIAPTPMLLRSELASLCHHHHFELPYLHISTQRHPHCMLNICNNGWPLPPRETHQDTLWSCYQLHKAYTRNTPQSSHKNLSKALTKHTPSTTQCNHRLIIKSSTRNMDTKFVTWPKRHSPHVH